MTNEKIILQERFLLMKNGVIGSSGRTFTIKLQDGSTREIPEPAEIHTYQGWKARGFQVKRGEHAKTSFPVWVPFKGKRDADGEPDADGAENVKLRLKKSFWFSPSQVEPIKREV